MNRRPAVSFIVPVLDEASSLPALLDRLRSHADASASPEHVELIVADGGSVDGSAEIARAHGARVISSARGRARQMNAGAVVARGRLLAFLHADTVPGQGVMTALLGLAESGKPVWGRFDVRLSGSAPMFRVIEQMMNLRSRLSSVATGDQLIFVSRDLFDAVGHYPDLPLMEDIAISKRLRGLQRGICRAERVRTSSRRWEQHGIWPTIFLMWRLRWAYFIGVDPDLLLVRYQGLPRKTELARDREP
ncbi:MAG: TIGR04283 family arsenosugar biosynthesis glycosyltransferase [Gammaproteobacteria bacterium]|nr:TIGR04283 family arsenosugar biosynthesis glycosyltransferase [Gammaproteobacteria bacterium]